MLVVSSSQVQILTKPEIRKLFRKFCQLTCIVVMPSSKVPSLIWITLSDSRFVQLFSISRSAPAITLRATYLSGRNPQYNFESSPSSFPPSKEISALETDEEKWKLIQKIAEEYAKKVGRR
jgi:hypothetical protein